MPTTTVVIADLSQGTLATALDAIFVPFDGVQSVLPKTGTVYVKPNGIHFAPHTHMHPRVLGALLAYLRDHGYARLAVMDNCTGGNFTRLVFKVSGYTEICHCDGAKAVYLDEDPTTATFRRQHCWTSV